MTKSLAISRAVNVASVGRLRYGWWTARFVSMERPIILGGCSRSGTTLLRELLNAHPEIYIGPETGILQGNRKLDHLARVTEIPRPLLQRMFRDSCCLGEFAEKVLKYLASGVGKATWGEKTPANVRCLRDICRFFPHARLVHIVRDGRDVVCSLRTHPKFEWRDGGYVRTGIENPWEECIEEWIGDVRRSLAVKGSAQHYLIHYEALVTSPREVLEPLLHWLGYEWSDKVLADYKTDRHLNHPQLAGPISSARVGSWQLELPRSARVRLAERGRDLLDELGYANDDRWIDS